MIQTRLFKNTFTLLFIVGVLNYIAVYLYLYWTVWWFDMLVHFLAGTCVAMATVLAYYFYNGRRIPVLYKSILLGIFGGIIIGVLWEAYELYFEIENIYDGLSYVLDTSSDLVLDTSGAILGGLYAHRILK